MNAEIEGEDKEYVKIYVTDNSGTEHNITLEKDSGEIPYHEQDGYSDKAANRTAEGNEHVEQARRFAQYYVYVDRGYDTVPSTDHPERINAVRLAIQELNDTEFKALTGRSQCLLRQRDRTVSSTVKTSTWVSIRSKPRLPPT